MDRAEFSFGGRAVPVRPGRTIGAALLAAGVRACRTSRVDGRPRGLFCGIGVCHDCLVTVGGRTVRACQHEAAPGETVIPGQAVPPPGAARTRAAGAGTAEPGRAASPDGTAEPRGAASPDGTAVRGGAGVASGEVLVVGAGPAGLAAALAAADAGCLVDLLDSAPLPGGQYHRQPAGAARPDPQAAGGLLAAAVGHPRIRWHPGTSVWAAEPGPRLYLRGGDGVMPGADGVTRGGDGFMPSADGVTHGGDGFVRGGDGLVPGADGLMRGGDGAVGVLEGRAVVLATGAYDRVLPLPGWDLPGVLTVGGMQALLKGQQVLAGRRVALSGTGPFLLPVAAALAEAGARVVGVFEAGHPGRWAGQLAAVRAVPGRVREGWDYLRVLRRHRVPVRWRHAIVRVAGDDEVSGAVVARLRPDWTVVPGSARHIEVDAVGLGYGFVPVLDLALALSAAATPEAVAVDPWQRTSVPGVFAAGELTGIGGAALAGAEGRLAGLAAAVHCGRLDREAAVRAGRDAYRDRARYRRFAAALEAVYPVRAGWRTWLSGDTVVCRCEEVRLSGLSHALADLAITDLRTLKLVTRAGMGMCQGRVCGTAVAELFRAHTGHAPPDPLRLATRPLAVPVPLGALADLEVTP